MPFVPPIPTPLLSDTPDTCTAEFCFIFMLPTDVFVPAYLPIPTILDVTKTGLHDVIVISPTVPESPQPIPTLDLVTSTLAPVRFIVPHVPEAPQPSPGPLYELTFTLGVALVFFITISPILDELPAPIPVPLYVESD